VTRTAPARPRRRAAAWCAAALAAALVAGLRADPAVAEDPEPSRFEMPAPGQAGETAAAVKRDREAALAELRKSMAVSDERQKALEAEIAALDKDRATLAAALISTGERIGGLEAAVAAAERRLARAHEDEAAIRVSLAERKAVLAEILAALERIGRRPPPALLVSPGDARGAVRSALLLGSVLPEIRVEADALAADLAALARIEAEITAERTARAADLAMLGEERARLELLVEEKRRLRTASGEALAAEQRAAEALAAEAGTLEELIATLERRIASSRAAAEAARKAVAGRPAAASPDRLEPAIAFADAKGTLPLPVAGHIAGRFGEDDEAGGARQGVTIRTVPGGQVSAPADGWAVYAGPFRSYGEILILNMGGGYHVLLAGMDRIDVDLGQFVLAGEPVGAMAASGAGGTSADGPMLYVEFRNRDSTIDPTPWWAAQQDEEVRG